MLLKIIARNELFRETGACYNATYFFFLGIIFGLMGKRLVETKRVNVSLLAINEYIC